MGVAASHIIKCRDGRGQRYRIDLRRITAFILLALVCVRIFSLHFTFSQLHNMLTTCCYRWLTSIKTDARNYVVRQLYATISRMSIYQSTLTFVYFNTASIALFTVAFWQPFSLQNKWNGDRQTYRQTSCSIVRAIRISVLKSRARVRGDVTMWHQYDEKCRVGKNRDFLPISCFISEMIR